MFDNSAPSESVSRVHAEKLFYGPATKLDTYGSLRVVFDFQTNVTREALEEHLKKVNPKLLERIEFDEA